MTNKIFIESLWVYVLKIHLNMFEYLKYLSKYFQTSDFLVGIHDGINAGQEIPHVHVHVIPRTKGDGGKTLLACWPNTPGIGQVEPNFEALEMLQNEINEANN